MKSINSVVRLFIVFALPIVCNDRYNDELKVQQPKGACFALKSTFLTMLKNKFNASVFIETGTYKGDTTNVAADVFDQVHTIELGVDLYEKAKERFIEKPNVFLYCGNSPDVLKQILPTISERVILWLDSHWSGGDTVLGEENTPVIKEIEAIKKSGHKNCIILIDDIRCFDPENSFYSTGMHYGYPSVHELKKAIKSINKNYCVQILGDILIAYLKQDDIACSPTLDACTKSRFFTGKRNISEIIDLEMNVIGNASQEEADAIKDLFHLFAERGHAKEYALWYGLIKLKNKDYKTAFEAFEKSHKSGLNHWRIFWYMALTAHHMGDKDIACMYLKKVLKHAKNFEAAKILYEDLLAN
jgi:hypothetical protein